MKHSYLFRFGYSTPEQWAANEKHGWDDESSAAFFVSADDEQTALEWGNTVADAFVRRLFARAGWSDPPSWKDAQFAAWIEDNPEAVFSSDSQHALPRIDAGQMPDFETWQPY